jgi:molybdenum cofactor cytidylyltransferase
MKFATLPLNETVGSILAHQCVDGEGRKLLGKGQRINMEDVSRLRGHGITHLAVVTLEPDDLDENEAARRIGAGVAGDHVQMTAPGVGRANLTAAERGVLHLNVEVLERLNNIDEGITIATLREHSLVQAGQLIALVKIIPYAMPLARVEDVEALAREAGQVLRVRPLQARTVGMIITGPAAQHATLTESFVPPARTRIEHLGSHLGTITTVEHTEDAIAAALDAQQQTGCEVILVAGIAATIDREDVVPSALRLARGSVAHFGVPVDPGNLLMLGYIGQTAVIGAPGCVKSLKTNVIDLILPRLFAGERLTRADLVALGHGGLLDDIAERPMPRQRN